MTNKKVSLFLIGFLLSLNPLHVIAMDTPGFSREVAAYMETNGMTIFEDPEIKAIQEELTSLGLMDEDLTDEQSKRAADLVGLLVSSIERVAREYMSGKRTSDTPVYTVQDYEEFPSCVDDGSCSEEKQPQLTTQSQPSQQSSQPQQAEQPAVGETFSFGEMLNNKQTDSLEAVRQNFKL